MKKIFRHLNKQYKKRGEEVFSRYVNHKEETCPIWLEYVKKYRSRFFGE